MFTGAPLPVWRRHMILLISVRWATCFINKMFRNYSKKELNIISTLLLIHRQKKKMRFDTRWFVSPAASAESARKDFCVSPIVHILSLLTHAEMIINHTFVSARLDTVVVCGVVHTTAARTQIKTRKSDATPTKRIPQHLICGILQI